MANSIWEVAEERIKKNYPYPIAQYVIQNPFSERFLSVLIRIIDERFSNLEMRIGHSVESSKQGDGSRDYSEWSIDELIEEFWLLFREVNSEFGFYFSNIKGGYGGAYHLGQAEFCLGEAIGIIEKAEIHMPGSIRFSD